MSVLSKPYELSVWEDVKQNDVLVEQKLCIIGAHDMVSQSRALQPKLVQNINGTNTFSFSMYYRYKDNITGEEVENPFIQYLTNERKLKLKYGDKWYDLIIKSVKIDSTKYSYEITTNDQYITELSKNGFNLTFDPELDNNLGTIQYLAGKTLEETDWNVVAAGDEYPSASGHYSEYINDYDKEALVNLNLSSAITAYQYTEDEETGEITLASTGTTITSGSSILAFYSCCKSENPYFQFIYYTGTLEKDDERVITTKNCHYQIEISDPYEYNYQSSYGISIPSFTVIPASGSFINSEYRGARFVYSPWVKFNSTLQKYVTEYTKGTTRGYGFSETKYIAPNFIQNFVTNANGFKSTAGWSTGVTSNQTTRGTLKNEAARSSDLTVTLIEDLESGDFGDGYTYIPYLLYEGASGNLIINTGFYDSRLNIENLENGESYVFKYRTTDNSNIRLRVGPYSNEAYVYTITSGNTLMDTSNAIETWTDGDYTYKVVTVENSAFTPNVYKKQKTNKVVLVISGFSDEFRIYDLQCYKAVLKDDGTYMSPEDQLTDAQIIDNYYIYDADEIDDATIVQTRDDFNPIWHGTVDPITDGWEASYSVEKRRGLTIKESNYYNIISTLCENFECWAEYYIEHDVDGNVLGKYLLFHNYTGDFNYAGFRYGVNLKSVQRTDDSKQIVSKLIVRQNSNEFGQNGFCTIARAPSNETGDTTLYNVDYYINQGLLSAADWNSIVYDVDEDAKGKDLDPEDITTNSNGYYVRLYNINKKLNTLNEALKNKAVALATAEANQQLYENGLLTARDQLKDAADSFKAVFGIEYDNFQTTDPSDTAHYIDINYLKYLPNLKYLTACAEAYTAVQDYTVKAADAITKYNDLKDEYDALEAQAEELREQKTSLNKAFYSLFYRYIQEGTWLSEDYYDDELYYIDGQATLYNSSTPKVSYSISVLELSQLIGYEGFDFAIGDRSYIEDPEFFGYDDNGYPIREAITLTEITYNLDQPEKNSIKVQNYKSQFQDLFKKITATVQSVQYSTGAYDKAAQLVDADASAKSAFLESGLNDAGTVLQNLADQTVRLDAEGLTITDGLEKNRILRAVSGGILMSNDGGNTWNLSIAPDGINAKTITTGTINTGAVNIMYGNEPTFRWDAFGITAYDFEHDSPLIPVVTRGVRFDRWGVYGFDLDAAGGSGATADWKPTAISGWVIDNNVLQPAPDTEFDKYIRNRSIFELTKEGLYLNLGRGKTLYDYNQTLSGPVERLYPKYHESASQLGKIEDLIYNSWSNDVPYYDTTKDSSDTDDFVKIMSVGNHAGNENFALYDDGTIKVKNIHLSGNLIYSDGSGLIKTVYSTTYLAPPQGTPWSSIPDSSVSGWHKVKTNSDVYSATTYDNGVSWLGPNRISAKDVDTSVLKYAVDATDTKTTSQLTWYSNRSDIDDSSHYGEYLYIGSLPTYEDGSSPTYPEIISIDIITSDGKNGTSVQVQDIYYTATFSLTPPTITVPNAWVTATTGSWGTTERSATAPVLPNTATWVYKAVQTRTIVYNSDNTIASETLTCTNPVLYKAWHDSNNTVAQESYAEFLILTQGGSTQGIYYGSDGKLQINANYIKSGAIDASLITTGALVVKDANNEILFKADATNKAVQISDFIVTKTSIYNGKATLTTNSNGVYIGTDGISLGANNSNTFKVTKAGVITANKGTIGGWTLESTGFTKGTAGSSGGIGLVPNGTTVNSIANVVIYAGANFKVTTDGTLYTTALQATGGTIGGWNIDTSCLEHGYRASSMTPKHEPAVDWYNDGSLVYVGSDGLSYYNTSWSGGQGRYTTLICSGGVTVYGVQSSSLGYTAITMTPQSLRFNTMTQRPNQSSGTSSYYTKVAAIEIRANDVRLTGTWSIPSAFIDSSARINKYDINSYTEAYNTLFDNLNPVTFKYKNGQSNRTHQGFIVDELKDALDIAGISTNDFAAYCLTDPSNPDGDGGIRYSEIIPLNTWQIQQLKSRIAELESRIQQLEKS